MTGEPPLKGGSRRAAHRTDALVEWASQPWVRLTAAAAIVIALAGGFTAVNLSHDDTTTVDTRVPAQGDALDSEAHETQPVAFAGGVLNTWSERTLAYDAWWRQVSPLLTPGAREAYAFTDPRLIPAIQGIKFASLVQGPSANTFTVYFSTSAGKFGIDVSRRDEASPWRANKVVFPGTRSMFG